jgi:hypothetical protein
MTDFLICPICKQKAKPIDSTVGTIGFDCPKHDKFRVAHTVRSSPAHWNASEELWGNALQRARSRHPDAWAAIIKDEDFDDYDYPTHPTVVGRRPGDPPT